HERNGAGGVRWRFERSWRRWRGQTCGLLSANERPRTVRFVSRSEKVKTALITGITGQDGAYLAEFLLDKGYEVHGIKRRTSSFNTDRIDHLYQDPHEQHVRLHLHYGDLTDATNVIRVIQKVQPDEIYNLSAQSHVGVCFATH